ncbi:MAG: hypothetical protein RLZZ182_999 [Pseudomonadota bacterium]
MTSRATQRPDAAELIFYGAVAVLLSALFLWPLWAFEHMGQPDYPNHLARLSVLLNQAHPAWHDYLAVTDLKFPNMAVDAVPLFFAHVLGVGPATALKCTATVAVLGLAWGTLALACAWQGRLNWLALLAFPMAYNRYFAWGFLGYALAMALAMWMVAAWVRLRDMPLDGRLGPWLWRLAFLVGQVALMLSHLAGFGLLWVAIAGVELARLWQAKRLDAATRRQWALLIGMLALAFGAYLLLDRCPGLPTHEQGWTLRSKLAGIRSPFYMYEAMPAMAVAALFAAGVMVSVKQRLQGGGSWSALAMAWMPALCVLAVALVLPFDLMGSYFLDQRLMPFAALLVLAGCPWMPQPRALVAFVVGLFLACGLKVEEIHRHWSAANDTMAEARQALRALPERARVVTIVASRLGGLESPSLRHAALFGLIDRGHVVPNLFAYPYDNFSVRYQAQARIDGAFMHYNDLVGPPPADLWPQVCGQYDHVLLTREPDILNLPACVEVMHKHAHFWLLKVRHTPASSP